MLYFETVIQQRTHQNRPEDTQYGQRQRTDFLTKNPGAEVKLRTVFQEAILYVAKNPEQASEWFGEHLRVKPALVRAAISEDPNYKAVSLETIEVGVTPEFQKETAERLTQIEKVGGIKKRPELRFR